MLVCPNSNSLFSLILNWSSTESVGQWTSAFDYSGILDFVVGGLLLYALIRRLTGQKDRNLQILCAFIAAIAGVCWVVDGKLNHRLSALQQLTADATQTAQSHRLLQTQSQLTNAFHQIAEQSNMLAAARIKPFKDRLIDCLNAINPSIVRHLKTGRNIRFSAMVPMWQKNELENLSAESEACEYMKPMPPPNLRTPTMAQVTEKTGTISLKYAVNFFISTNLVR